MLEIAEADAIPVVELRNRGFACPVQGAPPVGQLPERIAAAVDDVHHSETEVPVGRTPPPGRRQACPNVQSTLTDAAAPVNATAMTDDIALSEVSKLRAPADSAGKALLQAIEDRRAVVGVIGLGYVGIPLALAAVAGTLSGPRLRHRRERASGSSTAARAPSSTSRHRSSAEAVDAGRFEATADFDRLGEADAILICVPTPLTRHREPDLSYRREAPRGRSPRACAAASSSCSNRRPIPARPTRCVKPILEASGLQERRRISSSPSRRSARTPATRISARPSIPKVVGGDGAEALALAEALYGSSSSRRPCRCPRPRPPRP